MNYKTYTLQAAKAAKSDGSSSSNGSFSGVGNVSGILDRDREVVAKGAYGNLSAFELEGFGAIAHDWHALPIAMIDRAEETEEGLDFEASYHSTQAAQDARTVVSERIDAGKSVGLSIGYQVLDYKDFATVDELAAYCSQTQIPFDRSSAKGYNGYCRLLLKIEVFEISIAPVPANASSVARSAKRLTGGRTLDGQSKELQAELEDIVVRFTDISQTRDGGLKGRALETLRSVRADLRKTLDTLEALEPDEIETKQADENPAPTPSAPYEPTDEDRALLSRLVTG